ncbi:MAG: protein kinase [Herpetosiphonaceae bacterium]|nr:protein kinase [Herpetosiphonaceae bacterium]
MHCAACGHVNPVASTYCQLCGHLVTSSVSGTTGGFAPQTRLAERYVIGRKLADGGFSAVYLAQDTRLGNCWVVVKEMAVGAQGTNPYAIQQAVTDFQQEAELLARISHPNLPHVSDRFEEDGKHFLVMDYVQGQTLREVQAATGGSLPELTVMAWATQLCDVLDFLHNQQPPIIYRDLKPDNVMLQPDGTIKLIDFGIARFYKTGKTNDTTSLGTPGYAPPEQFGHGQSDARTDVYALGAMLYELLTGYDVGATPFTFPPARQINPQLSARTEAALSQATQRDRDQRFSTIAAFKQALGYAPTPAPLPAPPMRKRRRYAWAVIPLTVVIAALGSGVFITYQTHLFDSVFARTPQNASTAVATAPTPTIAVLPSPTPTPSAIPPTATVSPTATPTVTATPTPTATATPNPIELRQEVEAAIQTYNDRRTEALRTSNTAMFDAITTGVQRDFEVQTINSDIATGAHHEIYIYSWQIRDISFANPNEANVTITKTEDRLFFPQGCTVPDDSDPCRRAVNKQNTRRNESYAVRYHMLKLDNVWKVDQFQVVP